VEVFSFILNYTKYWTEYQMGLGNASVVDGQVTLTVEFETLHWITVLYMVWGYYSGAGGNITILYHVI